MPIHGFRFSPMLRLAWTLGPYGMSVFLHAEPSRNYPSSSCGRIDKMLDIYIQLLFFTDTVIAIKAVPPLI